MLDAHQIPANGIDKDELLEQMEAMRTNDANWREGRTWSLVYYPGDEHYDLVKKAYSAFLAENALNPMAFRSLKRMEAEVVRMSATMLNGDDDVVGTMTSGGTESILMAVKASRERAWAGKAWPRRPEIVAPRTVHPAFAKAAHYFGMRMRYADVDEDFRADVSEMERLINRRTVLIVASAPQYPHGMIDPIPEIGAIAERKGIPFHVDACFGGFILPWIEKLGYELPTFDFRVPGVTSMSADLHKYGYAPKGASVVLYRDMSYLKHQFFVSTEFPGGIYASPTMAGTRPGGAIAAAWASLRGMGEDGYMALAKEAMDTKNRLKAAIEEIDELKVIGSQHATIVSFISTHPDLGIYALADAMQERGWSLDRQQKPPSLHCSVTSNHASILDEFLVDLRECVEICRENPSLSTEGEAAMYGMMAKIPFRGMVKMSVQKVMEELYGKNSAEPDLANIGGGEDAGPLLQLVDRYGDRILGELDRLDGFRDAARDLGRKLRPGR